MQISTISYPRIGAKRELKFGIEKYFKGEISQSELLNLAKDLRQVHWSEQKKNKIDFLSCNDFSFYDNILDAAVLFNIVPKRYKDLGLDSLDEYFALARGYQGDKGDVKALAMKKWFNTNYHYLVPECEDASKIALVGEKIFNEFLEAKALGYCPKVVIVGIFTLLKLISFSNEKDFNVACESLLKAYQALLGKLKDIGVEWIQFDEPALVCDLDSQDKELLGRLYGALLTHKNGLKVLLQTYFGDIRDCYEQVLGFDIEGVGLDFIEGIKSLELVQKYGFDANKILFAGIVNGKNIYKNHYTKSLKVIATLQKSAQHIVLNTSCSLLHVPYTLQNESKLPAKTLQHLAFAQEKLQELNELREIADSRNDTHPLLESNTTLHAHRLESRNDELNKKIAALDLGHIKRLPSFKERQSVQKQTLNLPLLPTTTIGSFPQTGDVRANRLAFKQGKISFEEYTAFNQAKIKECVKLQEDLGFDVLVHGEFERNDMVEYFGESLEGFIFTQNGWVQSYGTRCVKPPIVWGDVSWKQPITAPYTTYAQSLTSKPMKGMLTGPVTILNWSFPREDISLKDSALQIAFAIAQEVLDLESKGIKVIQIDEAALREKLPLRKGDWHTQYLNWAIPAFNLVHKDVKPQTQIHTHMCYSEFNDIIKEIDAMDADVISFEASRSNLELLDALVANHFQTEVGPGVYDIHSPRVPKVEEIKNTLKAILSKLPKGQVWVNPDCGLKTRNNPEVVESLKHLIQATKEIREEWR